MPCELAVAAALSPEEPVLGCEQLLVLWLVHWTDSMPANRSALSAHSNKQQPDAVISDQWCVFARPQQRTCLSSMSLSLQAHVRCLQQLHQFDIYMVLAQVLLPAWLPALWADRRRYTWALQSANDARPVGRLGSHMFSQLRRRSKLSPCTAMFLPAEGMAACQERVRRVEQLVAACGARNDSVSCCGQGEDELGCMCTAQHAYHRGHVRCGVHSATTPSRAPR